MSILIVYGSNSGNTKKVVESVSVFLTKEGHDVELQQAKDTDPAQVVDSDLCILASPTYAKGMLHYLMAGFMKEFRELKLAGKLCAVIALGEINFTSFKN